MTDRKTASTINDTELDTLYDQLAALRTVSRGYCPACGRGDAAPTADDWEQQKQRADQAEATLDRVRDLRDDLGDITGARWIATALDNILGPQPTTNASEWCGSRTRHDAHHWLDYAMHRRCPGHDPDTTETDGPKQPAAPPEAEYVAAAWNTLQTMVNRVREATIIPHITAHPVTPEMERAATERAIQAAADSERAREWIAAHSGPTEAEERAAQLAALAREILYTGHITTSNITRWRETLDTITDQEKRS